MRATWFLAWLLAALPLAAQAVPMRSGAHDGFTRLVVEMNRAGTWQEQREGNSYVLVYAGLEQAIDGSGVFKRVTHERLASVRTQAAVGATRIELELACDCAVRSFRHQGVYLVIDILDILDVRAPEPGAATAPPRLGAAPAFDRVPVLPPWGQVEANTGADSPAVEATPKILARADAEADDPVATTDDSAEVADVAAAADLAAFRDRLVDGLATAADQGILEFSRAAPGPAAPALQPAQPEPKDAEVPAFELPPGDAVQVQVTSVFERDRRAAELGRQLQTGTGCPPEAWVAAADWARQDFGAALAQARSALTGEFDRADTAAALDIARIYVGFGFGAEARQILDLFDLRSSEAQLLRDMADVVDARAPAGGALATVADCPGNAGLWALAAGFADAGADFAALSAALEAYPLRLRQDLAVRAGETLLAAGRKQDLARLLDLLDRAPGPRPQGLALLRAALALEAGEAPGAMADLAALALGDTPEAAKALLLLAREGRAHGRPLDPALTDELGTRAWLMRGSETGAELQREAVMARLGAGGPAQALAELAAAFETAGSDRDALRSTAAEVFVQAAESGTSPVELVNLYTRFSAVLPTDATGAAARLRVAGAAVSVVPSMVDRILGYEAGGGPEVQRIHAAAALEMGNAAGALVALAADPSPEADLMRVRAHLALGQFEEAAALVLALAPEARAEVQLGWSSLQWDVAVQRDPAAARFLQLVAARPPALEPSAGEPERLDDYRRILADQTQAREALDAELAAVSALSPPGW